VILKQEAQSFSEELCLLLIGIHMMSTILCQVVEPSDVLIHTVSSLLKIQEFPPLAVHDAYWHVALAEYRAEVIQ
jgi:hypothetical protein